MVIKNKYLAMLIYCICCVIFWNLLEYIIVTFISHSPFTFTIMTSIVDPLVVGIVTGYFVVYRNFDKKD